MQSIDESTLKNPDELDLVPAQELAEITLSPEQLYEIQKNNTLKSLMESMVKVATQNGAHQYSANILANLNPQLVGDIQSTFEGLGYKVALSEVQTVPETKQTYRVVSINWENTDVSDRSED